MKIGILKETQNGEKRVCISPNITKQLIVLEHDQEKTYNSNKRLSLYIPSLLVSFLLVIGNNSLLAQDSTKSIKNNHHFTRIGYQYGTVLKTSNFAKGINLTSEPIDNYQAARIEFGWQKTGSKMWHAIWNYPTFGLGFYGVNYIGEEQLGNPLALYGFTELPLIRNGDLIFSMQLGFGLSFNWKPFDPITNPYNEAIGNFQAAYIDVGITLDYNISNQFELVAALTGTHFSNGGSQQPNWGLNQLGLWLWSSISSNQKIRHIQIMIFLIMKKAMSG